ncbi:MAG TPA: ATP-binding cassette domain-containing protein [Verrucomicrobiae bacterium]|nr:ATP-binding cassette domain-containing protein [Verrucomicrobiae bacterium]
MAEDIDKKAKVQPVTIELAGVLVMHYEDTSDAVVVRDVTWRIGAGEFWVVGGRPSSGKSSLLLTAAALNRPAGGTLRIFGEDFNHARERDRIAWSRRIGFVFAESGRLFSHLTVARNIALPLQYRPNLDERVIAARVEELLGQIGLRDFASSMPSRLSLSAQQRVALARALAPISESGQATIDVLFLDNPLTTLSLREARWWVNFLGKLRESRRAGGNPLAIVASADDFGGWIDVAEQFAVVDGGQFRVIGGRERVEAANEPMVRELLTSEI